MLKKGKIEVLVVDNSASVRQTLCAIIDAAPDMEVMATAGDPFVAAQRIQEEVPDVIILDVEMPRMDGITFLRKIMAQRPIPVVMCSTLLEDGSETLLEALDAGAVDVILKPRIDTKQFLNEIAGPDLRRRQGCGRASCSVRARRDRRGPRDGRTKLTADVIMPPPAPAGRWRARPTNVVCIGASTGGTESLRDVLDGAAAPNCPGIVIVQHMPEKFTAAFAERLDGLCEIEVKEAEDGDQVLRRPRADRAGQPPHAAAAQRRALLSSPYQGRPAGVAPSPLGRRAVPLGGAVRRRNALGVIMTGMGDDGARGLLEMKKAGAATVAQDEETCVVFGMPKEAIALGAADRVMALMAIPQAILEFAAMAEHIHA